MGRLCGLAMMAVALVVLASTACNQLSRLNIPGIIQGQVLNEAGQGQGFLSMHLIDEATGKEADRETTDDLGNFMFEKVSPGKYLLKIYGMGEKEVSTDAKEIKLLPGKTLSLTLTLQPNQP